MRTLLRDRHDVVQETLVLTSVLVGWLEVLPDCPDALGVARRARPDPPPAVAARTPCGSAPLVDTVKISDPGEDVTGRKNRRNLLGQAAHADSSEVDHIGSPTSCDHSVTSPSVLADKPAGCNAVTCTSLARSEGFEPPTF